MALSEAVVQLQTKAGPMQALLYLPASAETGGKVPGVVVVQEAFGVNTAIQEACRKLAVAGYAAIAPELFHRSAAPGAVFPYDFAVVGPHFAKLTNDGIAEDLGVARDFLAAHPRVRRDRLGVIGFCVGGFAAYLGACRLELAAAVVCYGGGLVHQRPQFALQPVLDETPRSPVLGLFGAKDASIPPADVEAIRARLARAGPGHEVVVYPDAGHAFLNQERPQNHHAPSAALGWEKILAFLGSKLGA